MSSTKDRLKSRLSSLASAPATQSGARAPALVGPDPLEEAAKKINEGHRVVLANAGTILKTVHLIGQELVRIKSELGHGEFTPWIESHLDFSERTARNYMNVAKNFARIEGAKIQDLNEAYKLLANASRDEASGVSSAVNGPLLLRRFRAGEKLREADRAHLREFLSARVKKLSQQQKELRKLIDDL